MTALRLALALSALGSFLPSPARAAPPDLSASLPRVRALLEQLVAAETVNPPGNEARAAGVGAARLRAAGVPHQVFEFAPGRANLVARLKGDGSAKPLLLLAHTDVVPTTNQPWTSPPHQLAEKDGYLVGRGTLDDLGAAALWLEVVQVLHERKVPLRRDVILAWTGDEERGGDGLAWQLEHARDSIADAGLALNEGGGVELDAKGKAMSCAIHVAEKIYVDFELRARGPSGHSSRPLPDNAIYRLSRALARLGPHRFPPRFLPVTRAFFLATASAEEPALRDAMKALAASEGALPPDALQVLDRKPSVASLLRTTCVATQLAGGSGPNVLPAEATANVNCRILPDESPEDVRRRLAEVVGDPGIEIVAKPGFGGASPQSPLGGDGPDAIARVVRRHFPDVPVIPYMSSFVTDSRALRAAGIPTYGFDGIATTDEESSRAHAADERMPARALGPALQMMYELVLDLAGR